MIFASEIAKPSLTTPISADNALGQILLVSVTGIEVLGREPADEVDQSTNPCLVPIRGVDARTAVLNSDLLLNGNLTLPERGDIIEEQTGTQTLLYEVTAPDKEPCWRYSDLHRQTLQNLYEAYWERLN